MIPIFINYYITYIYVYVKINLYVSYVIIHYNAIPLFVYMHIVYYVDCAWLQCTILHINFHLHKFVLLPHLSQVLESIQHFAKI